MAFWVRPASAGLAGRCNNFETVGISIAQLTLPQTTHMNPELSILEAELLEQKVAEIYNEIQPIITTLRETIVKHFNAPVLAADYRSQEAQNEVANFLNDWFRCVVTYKLGTYHFTLMLVELPKDLPPLLRSILLNNAIAEHIAAVKEYKLAANKPAMPEVIAGGDLQLWKSYFGEPTKPLQIPSGYIYAGEEQLPVLAEYTTTDIAWFIHKKPSNSAWKGEGEGPWAIKVGSEIYYKNLEYIKSCPQPCPP